MCKTLRDAMNKESTPTELEFSQRRIQLLRAICKDYEDKLASSLSLKRELVEALNELHIEAHGENCATPPTSCYASLLITRAEKELA
jgi:hypothetical protein